MRSKAAATALGIIKSLGEARCLGPASTLGQDGMGVCMSSMSSSSSSSASDHPVVPAQAAPKAASSAATSTSSSSEEPKHWRKQDGSWDWAFVIGAKPGRKPAIKRMQRHQWHFCNPNYDPNLPLPARILPPHAPPSAAHADDWVLFNSSLSNDKMSAKSRQEFVRYLRLRDVDWRDAFQRGLAEHVAEFKKERRMREERLRQEAWHEYRERVFAEALAKRGGEGSEGR